MKIITTTIFGLIAFTSLTFLTSCKNNEEKIEFAQENLLDAKKDLIEAKQDSLADYESFKIKINEKITANELRITDLKVKVINGSNSDKAKYNEKIILLEEKNRELKTKVDTYSQYQADTWEAFKIELDNNVIELENEFNEFNAKR